MTTRPLRPHSTLRLQFHRDFGFAEALAQLDYFAALGVSHLYASPIFSARSGSTHGYDVVDPTSVNPELGGEDGLRRLVQALHARGMGLVLDIVPNHMALDARNPWWQDVLLWGRHSRYATWFDIDWLPVDPALHGKVLLPILGRSYGAVLADGELSLRWDEARARLHIDYAGNHLPLAPEDYVDIFGGIAALDSVATVFGDVLEAAVQSERRGRAELAWQTLQEVAATAAGQQAIAQALARFAGAGSAALHALLERQHYRLCDWRNAGDEINWRRFFEIGDLIGMRVEQEEVFDATHGLLLHLVQEGLVDGVRIDHIDGLAAPRAYVQRLRTRLQACRPSAVPIYITAEKILAGDEHLPGDWGLDGTSGYDFMEQAGGWLHDAAGAPVLDAIWKEYRADTEDFAQLVRSTRRRLLGHNFASEFNALAATLHALARADVASRDITLMSIRRCLLELLAYFPVYRTYGEADGCNQRDAFLIRATAARAREQLRKRDHATLDALAGWLADAPQYHSQLHAQLHAQALVRFQQLTPPLTAKSTEDTAFYRYGRLLSRNEVGGEPARLAWSSEDFHRQAAQRQRDFPEAMLATATHDHKRGEDARARVAVLSEQPQQWRQTLQRWRALNQSARVQAPIDAVDELMLYQTLVGVWPLELRSDEALAQLQKRVSAWQQKALREAKRRSDWTTPDEVYEATCESFLRHILRRRDDNAFLPALRSFVNSIAAAGALNGLAQTMLRLTTPGVPDLYQGCELWDFSLVDPDNRRAVDYPLRQALMTQSQAQPLTLEDWRSGVCKQQLIHMLLHFRSAHADLLTHGVYLPLQVQGRLADHLLAFARCHGTLTVVVLCSRHGAAFMDATGAPLIAAQHWADTAVVLPADWRGRGAQGLQQWQSVLTGTRGALQDGHCQSLAVGSVLDRLPVDLLVLSAAPAV